ncbi:MAG: Fic family protein [Roseateles sp.]|uniref:Fic/DOC family protein n=1 Tax=Roseateles sp. TaxID=1971397 RepID=UPI0039ED1771
MGRYAIGGDEGECQPGSDGRVLRNLAGIASPEDMDELELALLAQLYDAVLVEDLPDRRLTVADLKTWHRRWLGNVYAWAGRERGVNMSKGDFLFASAAQLPRLLANFERDCLARWTPCHGMADAALVEAIAVTHVEFILIHPFRDGNGRLSRLLADVMAVQAGRPPLDYGSWASGKDAYVAAIRAGHAGHYGPMCAHVAQAMGLG